MPIQNKCPVPIISSLSRVLCFFILLITTELTGYGDIKKVTKKPRYNSKRGFFVTFLIPHKISSWRHNYWGVNILGESWCSSKNATKYWAKPNYSRKTSHILYIKKCEKICVEQNRFCLLYGIDGEENYNHNFSKLYERILAKNNKLCKCRPDGDCDRTD